jgi:hypothetical protein
MKGGPKVKARRFARPQRFIRKTRCATNKLKGRLKTMLDRKGRADAVLALALVAATTLGCSALKNLGKNSFEDANKLVQSAKEDLDEIDRINEDADAKQDDLNRAEKDKNVDEVKRILGDLIDDIDKGLERGESAAEKIEKASKATDDPQYKDYLALKAQAFRKEIDAFKTLREAAVIARDSYTSNGLPEDKRKEYRSKVDAYKKLKNEGKDLHRKADDIARKNPDKIKSS